MPVVATNGVRFALRRNARCSTSSRASATKPIWRVPGKNWRETRNAISSLPKRWRALFHDLPGAVAATADLAERLQYTMADLGYRFPEYPVPPGETASSFLRKLSDLGARDRYRPYHDRARTQVERELDLIERLNLAGYFLIVWDIVNFCRQHDILVQGRGSAANSAVCYSLGITAVDPVGMDLCSSGFCRKSAANGPTSISICPAATAASR